MSGRDSHLEAALGKDLLLKVKESRVLVVGAGGIGCELLKNLVLSGFQNIEVIDLDTIDVSNLNRQFLFRSKHVGLPKSSVAREAAIEFNPNAAIKAFHGNIKDEEFGVGYFQGFDLVLNALDNVNARQHVNRMCLSAEIPLIDAGTTGYLGQTTVIKKGETKCYDCEPKTENKRSYPICTIRNTPEKPVHCIVWAKELFKLMFGNMNESMLSGTEEDSDSTENENDESNELKEKEKEVRSVIMSAVVRPSGADIDDAVRLKEYGRAVFDAVFDNEIRLKLKLRDGYKGAKKKPTPLPFSLAVSDEMNSSTAANQQSGLKDQRVLSLRECAYLFLDCVNKMWSTDRRASIGDAVFDKDDELSLDFVTAAANLRSHVFGIDRKSKFDVKGIAGNIIHAIATTNAIVAGLQVIEAIKLLSKLKSSPLKIQAFAGNEKSDLITQHSRAVWVVREPIGASFLLQSTKLGPPISQCVSCGNAILTLLIDTTKSTLGTIVSSVLKGRLGVHQPTIISESSELYSEGDGLDDEEIETFNANLPKLLVDCPAGGIKDGTILDVEDFLQHLEFKVVVRHKPNKEFEEEGNTDLFILTGETPLVRDTQDGVSAVASSDSDLYQNKSNGVSSLNEDEVLIVEDLDDVSSDKKRQRDDEATSLSNHSKKSKSDEEDGVIAIDD